MILHIDMDAFYASVEELDRPELAGRPVIVGGDPDARGVVSAANYAARRFGVHSAMPSATARRNCPQAVFIRPRLDRYAEVSRRIRGIFERYTPLVEPLSLDEAFLDVRGSVGLFGLPAEIGRKIKTEIRDELRLVASVGVAPNKFLAKIASDLNKPDGFVVVQPDRAQEFLDPLPVGRLWGVGKVADRSLQKLGVRTVGQLRRLPIDVLRARFGSAGRHLWQLAHGLDDRTVVPDHQAKSISHETTFAIDVADREVLRAWLLELTGQVARRLRRHGLRGRTVQLKVRFADFRTITRSQTLGEPTHATDELWQAAVEMLTSRLPAAHPPVRLLGMGVSGLDGSGETQRPLFDVAGQRRQTQLDAVTDAIQDRYGRSAIGRAGAMRRKGGSEEDE
ncbi:MAG: DNA polymerase IV [Pirellulales bacterium]|nr:DNA polymerase IV [Pirellulales bacterium]